MVQASTQIDRDIVPLQGIVSGFESAAAQHPLETQEPVLAFHVQGRSQDRFQSPGFFERLDIFRIVDTLQPVERDRSRPQQHSPAQQMSPAQVTENAEGPPRVVFGKGNIDLVTLVNDKARPRRPAFSSEQGFNSTPHETEGAAWTLRGQVRC